MRCVDYKFLDSKILAQDIKIVGAAIICNKKVYIGWRHSDIIRYLISNNLSDYITQESQGFVDQFDCFHDRRSSAIIAFMNGQTKTFKTDLFSEDVWDNDGTPRLGEAYDPMGDAQKDFLPVDGKIANEDALEIEEDGELIKWSIPKFVDQLDTRKHWSVDRKIRAVYTYVGSLIESGDDEQICKLIESLDVKTITPEIGGAFVFILSQPNSRFSKEMSDRVQKARDEFKYKLQRYK